MAPELFFSVMCGLLIFVTRWSALLPQEWRSPTRLVYLKKKTTMGQIKFHVAALDGGTKKSIPKIR